MDALEGIQVVDLSRGIAGPTVGMFLADFGAEVIKIEPPGGDPARAEPGFAAWNRGMHSLAVDLQSAAGADALRRLAAASDVVLEALRPGVAGRLGIDYRRPGRRPDATGAAPVIPLSDV